MKNMKALTFLVAFNLVMAFVYKMDPVDGYLRGFRLVALVGFDVLVLLVLLLMHFVKSRKGTVAEEKK